MIAQYQTNLIARRMDENGDMIFGAGDAGFCGGLEAMTQLLKTRIAAIEDEWWEGDAKAIPWISSVLASPTIARNKDAIDLMVIERIMDTVGVIGVSDIESAFSGRSYSFSCKVQTVYGDTTAEVNTNELL